MSVQILGTNATNKWKVDPQTSGQITPYHPDITGNGAYRIAAASGLITGIAAGTATAGHIFAARWNNVSKLALVTYFRARWSTIAGFTAAQEVGLDLYIARSYTASHTGGTALTLTGNNAKKRSSQATTNFADMRISATGALTNVATTLDAQPIAYGCVSELATGATIPKLSFDIIYELDDTSMHPIVLSQDTGLVLRNTILMGAGGTARVSIEMEWMEVDSY